MGVYVFKKYYIIVCMLLVCGNIVATEIDYEKLRLAAEKTMAPTMTIHHLPFPVSAEMVYDALLKADAIGSAYRARRSQSVSK